MQFDYIDYSHKYLEDVLCIIRYGILKNKQRLKKNKREGLKNQPLAEIFNIIGTRCTMSKTWIGVQKEHERKDNKGKEDIYFHLDDDSHTRIFYVEAKRLPKHQSKCGEEYVIGKNTAGNPSGGIQRYKLAIHGDYNLRHNGMIAYVENKSIGEWLLKINNRISVEYPSDSFLIQDKFFNEYTSIHTYQDLRESFAMHHFWIDLT